MRWVSLGSPLHQCSDEVAPSVQERLRLREFGYPSRYDRFSLSDLVQMGLGQIYVERMKHREVRRCAQRSSATAWQRAVSFHGGECYLGLEGSAVVSSFATHLLTLFSGLIRSQDSTLTSTQAVQRTRTVSKYLHGKLQRDSYHHLKTEYSLRQSEVSEPLNAQESGKDEFEKFAQYGLSFISDLAGGYLNAPLMTKTKLIGWIFPNKLIFESGKYRTTTPNDLLVAVTDFSDDLGDKK